MQPSEDPIVEQARLRHEARKLREEIAGEEKMLDEAARVMRRKWIWKSLLPGLIVLPATWAFLFILGGTGLTVLAIFVYYVAPAWAIVCASQIISTCRTLRPYSKWLIGTGLAVLLWTANVVLAYGLMLGTCAFFQLF